MKIAINNLSNFVTNYRKEINNLSFLYDII